MSECWNARMDAAMAECWNARKAANINSKMMLYEECFHDHFPLSLFSLHNLIKI
jgi:hypothetical protein